MKWFLVVMFMEWEQYPIYMFTEPTFESREECIASAMDPNEIPKYLNQLLLAYGRPMSVQGINCITEDIANKLLMQDSI